MSHSIERGQILGSVCFEDYQDGRLGSYVTLTVVSLTSKAVRTYLSPAISASGN